MKKILIFTLSVLIGAMVSTGCGKQNENIAVESTLQNESESLKENVLEDSEESNMRKIVDMGGREVLIPKDINKVYAGTPISFNYMLTIDDHMLIGKLFDTPKASKKFMSDYFNDMPIIGRYGAGSGEETTAEEIIKMNPDIILDLYLDEKSIEDGDIMQEKLGIPVLLVDPRMSKTPDVYRFLGDVFNKKEECEKKAVYIENTISHAEEIAKSIPEDKKVTVYFAEGEAGLNTDPSGSRHSALIDIAGGINVAEVDFEGRNGRTEVSMEQLMNWNPQYIIALSEMWDPEGGPYKLIKNDEKWSLIDAVSNGHVYRTPAYPHNWFDRPPAVNTVIGIKWTQQLLYPEFVDYDIIDAAKEFFSLFYGYDYTNDEIKEILKES